MIRRNLNKKEPKAEPEPESEPEEPKVEKTEIEGVKIEENGK